MKLTIIETLLEDDPKGATYSHDGEGYGTFIQRVLGDHDTVKDPKSGIWYHQQRSTGAVFTDGHPEDNSNRHMLVKTGKKKLPAPTKAELARRDMDKYNRRFGV